MSLIVLGHSGTITYYLRPTDARIWEISGRVWVKYFLGVVVLVEGKTSPMTHLTRFWNQYLMIYTYFPENREKTMKFILF
jgi:hypothetical protein